MIHSWSIGEARVTSVVEYVGPTHSPEATFPDFTDERFAARSAELPPGSWHADIRRFSVAIQIWVLRAGSDVVLIDTGVGNRKPRPVPRMNMLNTLAPNWLAAAGAAPEQVTHVLMTHLHTDHVGWNTTFEDGRWTPTFPNARYLIPRADFDHFKGVRDSGKAFDASFDDSVMPVIEAGMADFIDAGTELPAGLLAAEAFGHTPGMLNYWFRSRGDTGLFSGDVFHHPVQILNPTWNTAFCVLPDQARKTRAAVLSDAASSDALVMPCHFSEPYAGYVRRAGDRYHFEPAIPGFPGP